MAATILLVNGNRIRPPIAPIGLEYLASAVEDTGFAVRILDLVWSSSLEHDLRAAVLERPLLVGLTFRNLDDSSAASRVSFIAEQRAIVEVLRAATDAPIVVGGAGLSIAPAAAMAALGVDFAVRGEGEEALPRLAEALARGSALDDVPGLVRRASGRVEESPSAPVDLRVLPAPRRRYVDNARYLREGAQVGFEASRGCAAGCTYCADPIAKGRRVRRRAPSSVADEIEALVRAGVDVFHTCDSEFNADPRQPIEVSEALTARCLGGRIRWYAYCAPLGFDAETARAMRQAGCVGVNFGIDHVHEGLLARLGRAHRLADVERARRACREEGLAVMLDLLLGAPGESRATIRQALAAVRALDPEAAGVALGLRLYRGASLADGLAPRDGPMQDGVSSATPDLLEPAFYVDPALGEDVEKWLGEEIGDDPRFFYLGPAGREEALASYNYNANASLERAIGAGARGAYWHILRRLRG